MGTRGPFQGVKARPGRDADHSPPYSAEVKNESRFEPRERTPGTHCTGGWVDPRAGLDTEATGKILSRLPGIEPRPPGRPAHSQTLY
jgi:hypothetical protein